MKDLVLEIGCENLPPNAVAAAFAQLEGDAIARLSELRLTLESVYATGTPRRLVLIVRGLSEVQESASETLTGPPISRAYDADGKPTKAAAGFARSHGIDVGKLKPVRTERGEFVGFTRRLKTQRTATLLKETLPALIAGLRWPKVMHWESQGVKFARPIRWILCLFGRTVVRFEIAGVRSGDITYTVPWIRRDRIHVRPRRTPGESKEASSRDVATCVDRYLSALADAGVILDHEARRRRIVELAAEVAAREGLELVEDVRLLSELTFMLEDPQPLLGTFDAAYLRLPAEVVITAMKAHQRYMAFRDDRGGLVPKFLTLTEGCVGSPATVRHGNEKVLRARLEDALFYWQEDLKTGISGLADKLSSIVFIEGLGTLQDKARRVERLAQAAVDMMGAEHPVNTDAAANPTRSAAPGPVDDVVSAENPVSCEAIAAAARFAKADLASEMIKDGKEFTLLQGLIGSHYAREAKQPEAVVAAIREQYLPRQAADPLPATWLGRLLSVADRLDTIVGCFVAGHAPTGSQDPYALRRQANGLLRIVEVYPAVHIDQLLDVAVAGYTESGFSTDAGPVSERLVEFFRNRSEWFLKERGLTYDAVAAVTAVVWASPGVAARRASAIERVRGNEAFELLITGAKRVGNILSPDKKCYGAPWEALEAAFLGSGRLSADIAVEVARFVDPAETKLYQEIRRAIPGMVRFEGTGDIDSAFATLATLGPAIDAYFESVLVNCDDEALRSARHEFLAAVFALFSKYADFSYIVEAGSVPTP